MAFPKANTYWKLRKKHGHGRRFDSLAALLQAAEGYFEWCDNNPWVRIEFAGQTNQRIQIPIPRPYTIRGLCLHLNVNPTYWRQLRVSRSLDEAYKAAIDRIDMIIYTQKFEGVVVGAFQANIISRDLQLPANRVIPKSAVVTVRRDLSDGSIIVTSSSN